MMFRNNAGYLEIVGKAERQRSNLDWGLRDSLSEKSLSWELRNESGINKSWRHFKRRDNRYKAQRCKTVGQIPGMQRCLWLECKEQEEEGWKWDWSLRLLWNAPKTRNIKARIEGWINGRYMIKQVENVNDKSPSVDSRCNFCFNFACPSGHFHNKMSGKKTEEVFRD